MVEKQIQLLKIPKKRVAVLIGTSGKTKKEIEEKTKTEINVDKEGSVEIKGESFEAWMAKKVVKAIGRGFSPKKAIKILNEGYMFELIEMKDWAKTENSMSRLKGRVIGKEGKAKRTIQEITQTYISVYGKTIGIIGETKKVLLSKRAVEMLLSGCQHTTVFNMLEKERKKWERERLLGG